MLLAANNTYPLINYQYDHIYDVKEKSKLFASKCMALSHKDCFNDDNDRDSSSLKGRFRFCVCTGGSKKNNKKPTAKWYIKVRLFK